MVLKGKGKQQLFHDLKAQEHREAFSELTTLLVGELCVIIIRMGFILMIKY